MSTLTVSVRRCTMVSEVMLPSKGHDGARASANANGRENEQVGWAVHHK
jgi:hypothetical protein